MENYLQQGILAAKAGDKPRAFDLLTRASEIPATSEQAWLWLSSVVTDDGERLFCLDSVLRINPDNAVARRGAVMLRQKGIFPAMPVYPEPSKTVTHSLTAQQTASAKPLERSSGKPTRTDVAPAPAATVSPALSSYGTDFKKQELSGLFQYAMMELESQKSRQAVEKLVMGRGASAEIAKTIVQDAQYALRKGRREKYKKRMTRGCLWTVAGIVITCGTYFFADSLGGKYVLFYGALIFGFIDFVIGLIGWVANA